MCGLWASFSFMEWRNDLGGEVGSGWLRIEASRETLRRRFVIVSVEDIVQKRRLYG